MDAVLQSIVDFAELGGPVVLILIGVSVLATCVALYKLWQFSMARVGHHSALTKALTSWDSGNILQAQTELQNSRSYLRDVVQMAMDGNADQARLETEAETRFAQLERGFRILDSIAQMAPLLGLFGTVLGMISAFQALQGAGSQVDPSILAGGIWVALLTTAVGLAVAMPTSLVQSWLESRMDAERVFAEKAIRTVLSPTQRTESPELRPDPSHA